MKKILTVCVGGGSSKGTYFLQKIIEIQSKYEEIWFLDV